jgi:hypothetical protein
MITLFLPRANPTTVGATRAVRITVGAAWPTCLLGQAETSPGGEVPVRRRRRAEDDGAVTEARESSTARSGGHIVVVTADD